MRESSSTLSGSSANGLNGIDYNDQNTSTRRYKYTRKSSRNSSGINNNDPLSKFTQPQTNITATQPFLVLVSLLALALAIQFFIVFQWHHGVMHEVHVLGKVEGANGAGSTSGGSSGAGSNLKPPSTDGAKRNVRNNSQNAQNTQNAPNTQNTQPHLHPQIPPLPPFLNVHSLPEPLSQKLQSDTLNGSPTIAGITLLLSKFLTAMHDSNVQLAQRQPPHRAQRDDVHDAFLQLTKEYIMPLESVYRDRPLFPIRNDQSIFLSLASFRDYLLGDTLKGAFDQASHPERLFVGAIVQNCFGLDPYPNAKDTEKVQCRTGAQVVGKDAHGRDTTKVSDAPPDRNGIEEFCTNEDYRRYCESGQVRVLYLHENESLGPAMARYYASKLWGGETYFMQVDSHLLFYKHWDDLYIAELKATQAYSQRGGKAVLSSYPPGFTEEGHSGKLPGDPSIGTRLCRCTFSDSDVESQIIRINTGESYKGGEEHPTQIPYIAAGFFFAPAEFLVDVPFDPYMPWCFMGEEIMLSMRAWTHGWDIYAPRKNWIAHQYRPGRMGLPKFWGSVGRLFGRPGPGFSNQLQLKLIQRVKHLVGYECCTRETLERGGDGSVLVDVEHYGFGEVRTREEYLEWANIDVGKKRCGRLAWCNNGELL